MTDKYWGKNMKYFNKSQIYVPLGDDDDGEEQYQTFLVNSEGQ